MDAEVGRARPLDECPHRSAGEEVMRRIGVLIVAVTAVLAGVQRQGVRGRRTTSSPPPTSGRRHARAGPRDRERGLHLRLPDGRQLPGAVRLLRQQAGSRVQGRLERDPQHRTGVHTRGQGDPDAELGHPVLGRRRRPARRTAGADGPADRAGPLLLAAVRRRLHLQLRLRRQPDHRQRRRQVPAGRARTGRATNPRASTRSSGPTPTWPSCCTAPSCSGRPTSTTSRRSRPATRSRRCRCS